MVIKNGHKVYEPIVDFYLPTYREEYFSFLVDKYPKIKAGFRRMTTNRLRAIYLALRTRRG